MTKEQLQCRCWELRAQHIEPLAMPAALWASDCHALLLASGQLTLQCEFYSVGAASAAAVCSSQLALHWHNSSIDATPLHFLWLYADAD